MKSDLFASDKQQIKSFSFSNENQLRAGKIIARYPQGRAGSALLPLLDLAQRQNDDWLPKAAIRYVANFLNVPETRAFEVATFYSMFRLTPRGKFLVQVCRTTPCWLRGSDTILDTCIKCLEIMVGETTKDDLFTLVEVECLGACVNAPVVQINDSYYEDLTHEKLVSIIEDLKGGKEPMAGSQAPNQEFQDYAEKIEDAGPFRGEDVTR